jgi:argininosuccinate synthase
MIDFCQQRGIQITATKSKPYSTDANILGLTHEAGVLEFLDTPPSAIQPVMGVHAEAAPDQAVNCTVVFEQGVPVAVNGEKGTPLQILTTLNSLGGKHGVGIATHLVENRFVGIKSRGVYEAPGMEVLGTCYGYLLELVLDRRAREFYDQVSRQVAKQIYQGYWFDLATTMALGSIKPVAALLTGTITVSLYKGRVSYVCADSVPHSLYNPDDASMEAVGSFDHADSEGLLRVLGISARALACAKQVAASCAARE